MKIVEPGHVYDLDWLDGQPAHDDRSNRLIFVNREAGTEHPGAQTQEVLRALIDRTQHCDGCLRWPGNDEIIYHLRMALMLHETRAIERKVEQGELLPELVDTGPDGHFKLWPSFTSPLTTGRLSVRRGYRGGAFPGDPELAEAPLKRDS